MPSNLLISIHKMFNKRITPLHTRKGEMIFSLLFRFSFVALEKKKEEEKIHKTRSKAVSTTGHMKSDIRKKVREGGGKSN